jgi:hypothetical protein
LISEFSSPSSHKLFSPIFTSDSITQSFSWYSVFLQLFWQWDVQSLHIRDLTLTFLSNVDNVRCQANHQTQHCPFLLKTSYTCQNLVVLM